MWEVTACGGVQEGYMEGSEASEQLKQRKEMRGEAGVMRREGYEMKGGKGVSEGMWEEL